LAPSVPTAVIPTIHELHDRGLPYAARQHLLFVGSFSHSPNVDAVRFMAREVLPLIRAALPEIELHVAGLNAPAEFDDYSSGGVKMLGFVPDLNAVMSTARVFVAPIRFGAGINGKIGEALGYGLPVVTTTLGAKGWGLTNEEQILVADSPADFANAVVRLYNDRALWQKLSDAGYGYIKQHNTPEVIGRISNESIKKLIEIS
jgi:glycosyltransferase involved in cell wall biosynthesis